MQQLATLWENLDARRKMIVVVTTFAVFAGVLSLSRMAAQSDMALLYSGLAPEAAGEVLSSLDSQGVSYDVRGGSIFVDSAQRDKLRLAMASEGLPANGGAGYELLDSMTGFGTTAQMFDVAYLRAKEGELARTIVANPQIKAARVHIAQSSKSPFRKTSAPTASVSIKSNNGAVSREAADAIRFLVSSAVAGLDRNDVSVIDAEQGMVIAQGDAEQPGSNAQDRADILRANVLRLIEARTGAGGAVVEVNVDTVSEEEMIVERSFDPDSRIAISTDTQESSNTSQNENGGNVTVASNLPDGDGADGGQSSEQGSESREIVNYEVSETTREIRRMPGSVARISVAVLVDGTRAVNAQGAEEWSARGDDELAMLEELVKSVVGFNEARGDVVTIRSMDLLPPQVAAGLGEEGWSNGNFFDPVPFIKPGLTALVVLALGFFVLRPVLMAARTPNLLTDPDLLEADTGLDDEPGEAGFPMALPMMGMDDDTSAMMGEPLGLPGGDFGNDAAQFDEDPVARLKNLIDERQDETVEVLRSWIETPEETV